MSELPAGVFAAALGALIGVLATFFVGWVQRKKVAAMSWETLRAEIEVCNNMAIAYIRARRTGGVPLPLSRWPSTFYVDSLKTIIAEHEIRPQEIPPIMAFYNIVDQINLAFDQALQARDRAVAQQPRTQRALRWATAPTFRMNTLPMRLFQNELNRLLLKTSHLIGSRDENDVYTPVNEVIQRNCQRFKRLGWRVLFLQLRR